MEPVKLFSSIRMAMIEKPFMPKKIGLPFDHYQLIVKQILK